MKRPFDFGVPHGPTNAAGLLLSGFGAIRSDESLAREAALMYLEPHLKVGIQLAVWNVEQVVFGISEAKLKAAYVREVQFELAQAAPHESPEAGAGGAAAAPGVLPLDFARDDLYSHENCLEDAALFGAWREAHGWGASAIINEPRMCLEYTKYMASYNVSGEVDLVDILSPADVA